MKFFMESKEKYDAVSWEPDAKLPFKDKLWNSIAPTFSCLLPFNIFGYYLLYFYTDVVGLDPTTAGAIIMFARVFDVFTDIMIGYCVDYFKPKAGKYRFWGLISFFPQLIDLVLVFTLFPAASYNFKVVWCFITYACYGALCATLGYIPQNCQVINMTKNVKERASVAGWKGLFENIAILLVAVAYMPLIKLIAGPSNNMARGFLIATIIFSVIAQFPILMNARYTRKYELNYDGTYRAHLLGNGKKKGLSFIDELKYFFTNRPAVVITMGAIILYVLQTVRNSMTVFLFEYYFQMPEMTSISLFFSCGLSMLGAMLVPKIVKLFKDSNRAFVIMAIFHSAMYAILYLWISASPMEVAQKSMHFGPMFILYAFCGLFQGMYYVFPNVMMPSAVDYGIYKHNVNQSGFIYSFFGAFLTLGGALGSFVSASLLASTGYVAKAVQSEATLKGMLFVGILLPAILSTLHGILQMFCGITDKKHDEWIKDIEVRGLSNLEEV